MRPQITYYGHSCFSILVGGKSILFDPFISPNPKAIGVDISTINPDVICISHGHGDHVADAVVIAKQSNARVISVYEVSEWLTAQSVENCIPMNIGGSIQVDFCTIKLVKAEHSSSFPDGSYGGLATGFVVHSSDFTFYYAGDTALTLDMQLIPLEFNLDFAFLPVGDNFTMGIKDAAKAAKLVQCKKVIAMHFDTFAPIEINHDEAIRYFESQQLNLTLPIINQTIQL